MSKGDGSTEITYIMYHYRNYLNTLYRNKTKKTQKMVSWLHLSKWCDSHIWFIHTRAFR